MIQKLFISVIGVICGIVMLAGCCQKQEVEKSLLTIKDISMPAKLYWLERAKGAETIPYEETVYLVEYDLERHELTRTNFLIGDGRLLETIETNHSGFVVVAQKIDDNSFRLYAFDENGKFDCRYSGTVSKYSSAYALYDGVLYYCDGWQSYQRNLSANTEQQLPDEIRLGGMCVSSEGKFFDCFEGDRKDSIHIRIVSEYEIMNNNYGFPEGTEPRCTCAVWKNCDTVLLAIELQLDKDNKEIQLFEFTPRDASLKPCLTEQGENIVLESAINGWLEAHSLQVDRSGNYISYVTVDPNYYNGMRDMDIFIQSLTDGKKYLVYSILNENGWYQAAAFTKACWGD